MIDSPKDPIGSAEIQRTLFGEEARTQPWLRSHDAIPPKKETFFFFFVMKNKNKGRNPEV